MSTPFPMIGTLISMKVDPRPTYVGPRSYTRRIVNTQPTYVGLRSYTYKG